MNKLLSQVKDVWDVSIYCILLAWKASPLYTLVRIFAQVFVAGFTVFLSYLGKYLIDLLTEFQRDHHMLILLLGISILTVLVKILNSSLNHIKSYCTGIHNDLLMNKLNVDMMDISLKADMEFFDSPQFYDSYTILRQDVYSVMNAIWTVMDGIGSVVTMVSAFVIMSRLNIFYGILIIAAIIPSTVSNQKFTKKMYMWEIGHINQQRKYGYLNSIVSSKGYAEDIRLYHLGQYLKNKYTALWVDSMIILL